MNTNRAVAACLVVALTQACGGDDASGPVQALSTSATITMAGGSRIISDSARLVAGFRNVDGDITDTTMVVRLGNDDDSTVVVIDAIAPGFASFRDSATNGRDNQFGVAAGPVNGGTGAIGYSESELFAGRPGSGVDLAGSSIDRLEFHIDTVSLVSPGTDPNGDGIWTNYRIVGRIVVMGRP
jgi:hypothetical protein